MNAENSSFDNFPSLSRSAASHFLLSLSIMSLYDVSSSSGSINRINTNQMNIGYLLHVLTCPCNLLIFFFFIQFNVPFKIISPIETSQLVGGAKREYPGKTT